MFNATHSRFNWRSPNVRLCMAAAMCAAGLAIGAISGGRLLAQLTGGNPTPAAETTKTCTYISEPCSTNVQGCFADIQNSMAVLVSYTGGSVLSTTGCGNMPNPAGEGTVPCGPDEPANCSN